MWGGHSAAWRRLQAIMPARLHDFFALASHGKSLTLLGFQQNCQRKALAFGGHNRPVFIYALGDWQAEVRVGDIMSFEI